MIITAALPWWNELPEDLDRCVRSLGNIADRVVALDGSYRRYPGATVKSSKAEVDAIRKAAKAVGIGCQIVQPERIWMGQVEKRTELLRLASDRSDWIVTVDADHVVHTDREAARAEIESHAPSACPNCSFDAIDVLFVTPDNPGKPGNEIAPGRWHLEQRGATIPIGHIWRVLPEMRVERFHWWYSAVKNGQKVWLWGDQPGQIPHQRLKTNYIVEHRCLFRTEKQIKASRAFLNDREIIVKLSGQEDDYEGSPPIEWDFERMPA